MLYSVPDPEVKLEDIATATPVMEHTLPEPPSVKGRGGEGERDHYYNFCLTVSATWLSVEGIAIGNTESGDTSSQDQVIINRTPNEVIITRETSTLSLSLSAVREAGIIFL